VRGKALSFGIERIGRSRCLTGVHTWLLLVKDPGMMTTIDDEKIDEGWADE
jgi:hypothetical protein